MVESLNQLKEINEERMKNTDSCFTQEYFDDMLNPPLPKW